MQKETWIDVNRIPFNFEVDVVSLTGGSMMKIRLGDADMVTMDLDVELKTFKTTKCNNQNPINSPLAIKDGGTGIWNFKANGENLEILQDGISLLSYSNQCLKSSVFTRIQFPVTDKISSRFRLQPGKMLKTLSSVSIKESK